MAFAIDMPAAARRHLLAADTLVQGPRRDVAGYLYGIAAECAIKAMMIDAGLRPSAGSPRREDPFLGSALFIMGSNDLTLTAACRVFQRAGRPLPSGFG